MSYKTYLTTIGAEQIAQSQIDGSIPAWSQMTLGDGGGAEVTASSKVTELVNPVYTAGLNTLARDDEDSATVVATMILPADVGGFTIREAGILDTDGNLVVYANLPETEKSTDGAPSTLTIRLRVQIGENAEVSFTADSDTLVSVEYLSTATAGYASALAYGRSMITDLESTEAVTFDGTSDVELGVTGVLPVSSGGTGAADLADVSVGHADTASTADVATAINAHTWITDLESTETVTFDGAEDVTLGVTGVLPETSGGTGDTSLLNITVGSALALAEAQDLIANLASTEPGSFDGTQGVSLGVTGVLGVDNGGTGTSDLSSLNVGSADMLAESHEFLTNLASSEAGEFNGTADVVLGVTGVLPVENGGTGETDLADVSVGYADEAGHAEDADTADIAISIETYSSSGTYNEGQLVIYNDEFYQCVQANGENISSSEVIIVSPTDDDGSEYWTLFEPEEYDSEADYSAGDIVALDGTYYQCIQANGASTYAEEDTETALVISPADDTDNTYWELYTAADDYSADADYVVDDVVNADGEYYICVKANGASTTANIVVAPGTDEAYWTLISSADLTGYYTKTEVDEAISASAVDLTDYYTKTEVDEAVSASAVDLSEYYTKTETDEVIAGLTANDISAIPTTGNAGVVSAYATAESTATVSESASEYIETSEDITVENGTEGTGWTKIVHCTADSPSVTTGDAWNWAGGEVPELTSGGFLVCVWCGSAGILQFQSVTTE